MKRLLSILLALVMVTCTMAALADAAPEKIKIAYISKMLTNPWFVSEDEGLTDAANELGVEYFGLDANLDDEQCNALIDNALVQGIHGLALTITNQGNGPSVAAKCAEKGVALITLDDNIEDMDGNPIPHVGLPTKEVGYLGGEKLAEYAKARDFFAEGNVVKVIQIDAPRVTVLKPRLDGYMEALLANTPLTEADFINVETSECMLEDSLAAVQPVIQGHPEVTHWIATGVNDDTAIACLKAIEEQGKIPLENALFCGLGGYSMSVEEFEKGNDSYMTIVLNPYLEGYTAMQLLYDHIVNGVDLPMETLINGTVATLDNWQELIK